MSSTDDLISRSALKEAAEREYNQNLDGIVRFGMNKIIDVIDNIPAVDVIDAQDETINEALKELRTGG